jgi:hypothetical protein
LKRWNEWRNDSRAQRLPCTGNPLRFGKYIKRITRKNSLFNTLETKFFACCFAPEGRPETAQRTALGTSSPHHFWESAIPKPDRLTPKIIVSSISNCVIQELMRSAVFGTPLGYSMGIAEKRRIWESVTIAAEHARRS